MTQKVSSILLNAIINDPIMTHRLAILFSRENSHMLEEACEAVVKNVIVDLDEVKDHFNRMFPGFNFKNPSMSIRNGRVTIFFNVDYPTYYTKKGETFMSRNYSLEESEIYTQKHNESWTNVDVDIHMLPHDMYKIEYLQK